MRNNRVITGLLLTIFGMAAAAWVFYRCLAPPATRVAVPVGPTPLDQRAVTQPPLLPISSDRAPHLGSITVGAFAPEVLPGTNISIVDLDSDSAYSTYRSAVHAAYGVDLADMNYLGVGLPGWQSRFQSLSHWLHRASEYGDPTVAIEPIGAARFSVFQDGPEMADLRSVFQEAGASGITIWVRFASESNLKYSVYSVYNNAEKINQYRHAARWFRAYMPKNVKLVFSPLINTVYLQNPYQIATIERMYEPGAYDRIGGTLYATSWLRPRIAFDWYYHFMRRLDPKTPCQICELGGIYPRSDEVRAFLIRVAQGDWPGVQRVNLFAGDLNPLAINEHGHFGFILPGETSSYLSDLLLAGAAGRRPKDLASSQQLDHLEQLGAGWHSPDMTLLGTVSRKPGENGNFSILVEEVTDEYGESTAISPARKKLVVLDDGCQGTELIRSVAVGATLQVIGWDSGTGTALRATQISPG